MKLTDKWNLLFSVSPVKNAGELWTLTLWRRAQTVVSTVVTATSVFSVPPSDSLTRSKLGNIWRLTVPLWWRIPSRNVVRAVSAKFTPMRSFTLRAVPTTRDVPSAPPVRDSSTSTQSTMGRIKKSTAKACSTNIPHFQHDFFFFFFFSKPG